MEDATCARRVEFYRRSARRLVCCARCPTECSKHSEITSRIKAYLRSHPEFADDHAAFIQGMGWDQNRWAPKQFPTAVGSQFTALRPPLRFSQDDLSNDPELAEKYIVLTRVDGHASWVSKPVLELMAAGGRIPENVDGGEIIRDKDGVSTGITMTSCPLSSLLMGPPGIFVDNAMGLVPIPDRTPAQVADYFKAAMHDALEVGLTSIHDAGGEDRYIGFFKE